MRERERERERERGWFTRPLKTPESERENERERIGFPVGVLDP